MFSFFFLLITYGRDRIVFVPNFRNVNLDVFTRFEVPPPMNPKITFLAIDLFLSLCVCVSVCLSVISLIKKYITTETPTTVFYICIIRNCYLKLFIKIVQIICVQQHTEFQYLTARSNFLLMYFSI